MRPLGILWAVGTLLIAIVVGVAAYQYGLHDGLAQQIQNLPANTVPAPYYGYPYYYGPHWGFGFPFFPLFGLFFLVLILFLVFRPRRWWGYGAGGPGPGGRFEEWHRRAHESETPSGQAKQ